MNFPSQTSLSVPISTIHRSDRWQVRHRLQELDIPCDCSANGLLSVKIYHPIAILQLRSVIQQTTAARADLIVWLERCWDAPVH
jgi:hypothetical protein